MFYEDVYMSQNKGGNWTMPVNLGEPVNGPTHDAAIAISPNGSRLFIYKDDGEGDMYLSTRKGLTWTKPVSLGPSINKKNSREASMSVTADGRTLYFSSNRAGGYGGLDIYKASSLKPNGEYSNVENLGPTINTPDDEDAPFIHPDGVTLYFSSRGHETMGGFDIFKSELMDGAFSLPENIGYPINTPGDDIYFVLSADGQNGYYASEKKGGLGFKDIYRIGMDKTAADSSASKSNISIAKSDSTKQLSQSLGAKNMKSVRIANAAKFVTPLVLVKGIVSDAETHKPISSRVVVVDNTASETVSESESNEVTGEYLVVLPAGKNYGISVNAQGYLFSSENFDLPDTTKYKEFVKNIELKRAVSGAKIVLKNIFFDTDKSSLRKESNVELEKIEALMKENPELHLEISGHTDNVGSAEHNQKLSIDRAQAVVDHLVKHNIDKVRLEAKGYGFTHPIATNDDAEGRQLNRRTELKVK
jgi:outer membrane protein OmpA-like peptidoglycan-associated protein